ncbi:MAG TPA: ISL3 family transposase [Burkholderiaceae bacterium]|nr:ISL3 family transposase [Burkholderiaceae bacterium]HQR77363.1 ISL3 family transposase [Burkholderiaceae bacterium]
MAEDLLRLPTLRATAVEELDDGSYLVHADIPKAVAFCTHCGSSQSYGHGIQEQRVVDVPNHGRRTIIALTRRRYRCMACRKTFFEAAPDLDNKRLATARLVAHVRKHCLRRTFADLAREVGLDDQTIRNIFDDLVKDLEKATQFETPRLLGLDEIKVVGRSRAVVTNVEENTLFDMLVDRNKATLMAYFRQMRDRDKVEVLTMDMWSVYAQVADKCFPGVPVVIDRFHVERMANDALEKVRKAVRKGLPTRQRLKLKDDRHLLLASFDRLSAEQRDTCAVWFEVYPQLGQAHAAKEGFAAIYRSASRAAAERAFDVWRDRLAPEVVPYFRDLVHAVMNRRRDVFNYFDHRITNAYTESVNNLIKLENRMGRGYSFEVLRARMLYDQQATKAGSTSVRKKAARPRQRPQPRPDTGLYTRVTPEMLRPAPRPTVEYVDEIVCYGAHIPTLVKLLEQGHFE